MRPLTKSEYTEYKEKAIRTKDYRRGSSNTSNSEPSVLNVDAARRKKDLLFRVHTDTNAQHFKKKYSHYLVLPDTNGVFQENLMYSFDSMGSVKVVRGAQQDGSVLRLLSSKLSQQGIIDYIMREHPHRLPMWPQALDLDATKIKEIFTHPNFSKGSYRYVAYWTHTFLNGTRVIPIIICEHLGTFYDVSCLFPQIIPEDEIGVLTDFDMGGPFAKQLAIPELGWVPEIIKYQSYWRMCPYCGSITDVSRVLKDPWKPLRGKNKPPYV